MIQHKLSSFFVLVFSTFFSVTIFALPFSNMYVIGDSLSDQGNLFAASEAITGTGAPAADHYFSGRFSNGEIAAGLLANKFGLNLSRSFDGVGTNFAYGGVRTDYNRVETGAGFGGTFDVDAYPWTLRSQKDAFVSRDINDPDGLYMVWSGSNDLADLTGGVLRGLIPQSEIPNVITNVIDGIQEVVNAFIAAGAQEILVPNVSDLGLVPRLIALDQQLAGGSGVVTSTATQLVTAFNAGLNAMLNTYTGTGVNIIQYDTFSLFQDIAQTPANFGFSNADAECYTGFVAPNDGTQTVCPDEATYVFWDNEHPTTAMQQVFANQFFAAVVVPEPTILSLFLLGFIGVFLPTLRSSSSRTKGHHSA